MTATRRDDPAYPSGDVVFLFTDIQGSTQRWERDPEAMWVAVERHFVLLRTVIERHHGVLFKRIGDAAQAAFFTAPEAVAASIEAQRALAAEDWGSIGPLWVRMALHLGPATPRDGDYLAPCLNRLARLLAAGYGGQILLSEAVAALVKDAPPSGAELRDLGEHRLRDLLQAQRVYQLVAPGLELDFPPLKSLDRQRHNLPAQPTALIGREGEIAAVAALLEREDVRLTTLTGPGGCGKTRLGLQVAADLIDSFADGVWFVSLSPVASATGVPSAIASVFGVRETGDRPLLDALTDELKPQHLLLVLDNFEHVTAAAPVVGHLLTACPRLKILVTSRALLHVYGEREFPVSPLPLPDASAPAVELLRNEAVRLFVERAQAARPDFAVTDANAPAIAGICRRLDGLPLAIELAAARVKLLPPTLLLTRLERRLVLLTGGSVDRPERQQTLRAAIAWSYDLLTSEEQTLFRTLAVFAGGCTLEAAEYVGDKAARRPGGQDDSNASPPVFDGIASLVDKSLLRQEETGGEPRFRMLETIREFGLEQLEQTGELDDVRTRHAAWCRELVTTAQPGLAGPAQQIWIARLATEHDNLRAALAWAIERGDTETALALSGGLWILWDIRGHLTEGRAWLERALALPGGSPAVRTKALRGAAMLAEVQGDFPRAVALNDEALAISRQLGDHRGEADALASLAGVATYRGDLVQAQALLVEALTLYRAIGHRPGESGALNDLGAVAFLQGDYVRAVAYYQDALAICRQLGDTQNLAIGLANLGDALRHQGDLAHSEPLYAEALPLFRTLGDKQGTALTLLSLGKTALARGDEVAAHPLLTESVSLLREVNDQTGLAVAFEALAAAAALAQQWTASARLLGAAAALRDAIGAPLPAAFRDEYERHAAATRLAIGEVTFEAEYTAGRRLSADAAVAMAANWTPPAPSAG